MKNIIKKLAITFGVLLSIFTLTGCLSSGSEDQIALVVVIGKHANQHEFTDKSYETLMPLINRAVYGGEVSVIIADGTPRYIDIMSEDGLPVNFEQDANNNIVKDRRVREYSEAVISFLKSDATQATNAEVDLLAALKEAARVLHDNNNKEKHIVIMDTGISTTGRVNFTKFNLNTLEMDSFMSSLSETEGILPDLSGINVSFIGLGDVAYPQILPDTTLPVLKTFWETLLVTCGVSKEMMSFPVSASGTVINYFTEDEGGFPYVSVINFQPIEISIREREVTQVFASGSKEAISYEIEENDEFESGELLLPDVGFHPDTARIIDEENALAILTPYADAMIQHLERNPDTKLFLLGTTASSSAPGGPGSISLSQNRADKLKETLVTLGVPSDRLITIGVGARVPEHLRVDEWPNGSFDTRLAQANRKATVYEIDNMDFQEIINFNKLDLSDL